MREIDNNQDILKTEGETNSKKRALVRIQQVLIATQEIGDEKLQVVQNIHDLIENKTRQLDVDFMNLGMIHFLITYKQINFLALK